jgi:phosphoribosylformylglycinamidine cyclo-ligase
MTNITYKNAGVDIDAGDELVRRLKRKLPHVGGFGGAFPLPLAEYREPLLVAGTDGVGTKIFLALKADRIEGVGIDLVAMSVNDIVTCGAKPLFFLDYYASGKLDVDAAEKVIDGIIAGCKESECVLLGGETAELPGMYRGEDFDLAGFAVGVVEKDRLIDGSTVRPGDVLIGLPSNGVHSNGYSLVRKILEISKVDLESKTPWEKAYFGEVLLRPTRIYVRQALDLVERFPVKGIAHITGGGLPGNVNRALSEGCDARIRLGS